MKHTLTTRRLELQLLDGASAPHAALYRELYTSDEVLRHVMPPLDVQQASAAFDRICRHNRAETPGHRHWAIMRHDGRPLGLAALLRQGAAAELGILLMPAAQRTGIATETFDVLVPHAFSTMGLNEIWAERRDDAHARVIDRLLEPFGFKRSHQVALEAGHCRWRLVKSDPLARVSSIR